MPTPTHTEYRRGDIITNPRHLRVGDVLAVIDQERLLGGLVALMARIAITRFHDTTADRLAGAGEPSHFHGQLTHNEPPEWNDGMGSPAEHVLISTQADRIYVIHHGTNTEVDLPFDRFFMLDSRF